MHKLLLNHWNLASLPVDIIFSSHLHSHVLNIFNITTMEVL